jgi:hypothetical protein
MKRSLPEYRQRSAGANPVKAGLRPPLRRGMRLDRVRLTRAQLAANPGRERTIIQLSYL